jgi:WD40 repeat protein
VISVKFSPDGSLLASGGWDYTVRLWDVKSGKAIRVLLGNPNWIAGIAFSADGRQLASTSGNYLKLQQTLTGKQIWMIQATEKIPTATGPVDEDLSMPIFALDQKSLLVGSTSGSVYQIDSASGKILRQLRPPK